MEARLNSLALWPLPLLVALLPAAGMGLGVLFSLAEGHIHCNPLLEGCATISRCGRYGTAFFVYKIFLAPSAALLAVFWLLAAVSARGVGPASAADRAIWACGLTSSVFLAIYVAYLGAEGGHYAVYRRLGASVFFAGCFLAQMLYVVALVRSGQGARAGLRLMRVLVLLQLLLGLISVPITAWAGPLGKDYWENLIEWWFALAMLGFFVAVAWAWRDRRLTLAHAA